MALRTTVYLDENVIEQVRRFIPQRGLSQLVNDLLQKISEAIFSHQTTPSPTTPVSSSIPLRAAVPKTEPIRLFESGSW